MAKITPTEKEFQEALVVVNAYIDNLNDKAKKINKTPIADWVIRHRLVCPKSVIATRLFNALMDYSKWELAECIEDVNIKRVRNIGVQCENLFNELRKNDYGK